MGQTAATTAKARPLTVGTCVLVERLDSNLEAMLGIGRNPVSADRLNTRLRGMILSFHDSERAVVIVRHHHDDSLAAYGVDEIYPFI